ncbi:MAG: hypothetical protein ABI835_02935 [Chloroflexota bacterium]
MNDAEFLKHLEAGDLHEFPHRAHIRMAWLYLRAEDFEQGSLKIRRQIRQIVERHGAPGKYHETISLFWIALVQYALSLTPEIDDFEAFVAAHDHLLDTRLIKAHYSPALLSASRKVWAAPDLRPLPGAAFEQEPT